MNRRAAHRAFLLLTLIGTSAIMSSQVSASQEARDRGPAPSAAALDACVDHKLGDRVIVKTTSGKSLSGTCRPYRDQLAARTHVRHKKEKGWWDTLTSWL